MFFRWAYRLAVLLYFTGFFMLTGRETCLLKAVLSFCGEDGGALILEEELFCKVKNKKITYKEMLFTLNSLQSDGYFEIIKCSRGEQNLLFVTPKLKAKCYKRERKQFTSGLIAKILIAVLGSVTAFLVTKILYGLF